MPGESEEQRQQQRTFLRERYLRMVGGVTGVEARVHLYDKTALTCTLGAADVDFQQLQVRGLGTPMGTLPHAMLRARDILSIHLPDLSKTSSDTG